MAPWASSSCPQRVRALIERGLAVALVLGYIHAVASPANVGISDIVSRHIKALGGEVSVARLHDYTLMLKYQEGAFGAASSLEQARPHFRLASVPAGPITRDTILEGYDGAA
jgi:hypothetical protein